MHHLSVDLIGRFYRSVPMFRGKYTLAQRLLAPLLRKGDYRVVVEMKNPGGGRLLCDLSDWVPWNVFLFGRYIAERECEDYMLSRLADNAIVVFDIGANIGYYSVQFARLIGPKGIVHSFEPLTHLGRVLEENRELNGLENIFIVNKIVSNIEEIQRIYIASEDNWGRSSLMRPSEKYEDVESITVDSYCDTLGIDHIDLVKIDVEGHELSVLKGMEKALEEHCVRDIFVELNSKNLCQSGTSVEDVVAYMNCFDYRPHTIEAGRALAGTPKGNESLVLFRRESLLSSSHTS